MKIHFLKESSLETLRKNIHANLNCYKNPSNEWIADACGEEPFVEFKAEISDFELKFDVNGEASKQDVENAIKLYDAMKNLSDTQATDERLWAGICHNDFYGFLNNRWQMSKPGKLKDNEVESRFFFAWNLKRGLFLNSLAKLWWCARLTYNEKLEDPFSLTRYFADDFTTKTLMIFSNNFMANKNIVTGLITALQKLEKENFVLPNQKKKREVYYEATRYLNVLGGTSILDFFSAEEIEDRVIRHLKAM
ncbi:DUF6339 family protein [Fibrobacter sp.]|uniref:DUF6339 family protein n=1 Tax=Fibrobacter sp. TaxID=35828 RepID=UPI0025C0859B|nr:DUF6339 family protein [Fibrobacter sp.]MBR3070821.1 hypothetical protein [Fibrobacter sp.]